jgi:hypothetical protein
VTVTDGELFVCLNISIVCFFSYTTFYFAHIFSCYSKQKKTFKNYGEDEEERVVLSFGSHKTAASFYVCCGKSSQDEMENFKMLAHGKNRVPFIVSLSDESLL